jgi:hypothetical protein
MAKPQQPEIARRGQSATDPGAVKSSLTASPRARSKNAPRPVPEGNAPGHHPAREQDKPSAETFVSKVKEHAKDRPPDPTIAGEALRAAAGAVRKVRRSLPKR